MGTSSPSTGPDGGVSLVPPWVPELPTTPGGEVGPEPESCIAPAARFGSARSSLGRFAQSGGMSNLRRGLGHYVKRGYGGAHTTTRRMGGTVTTAGALYSLLGSGVGDRLDRLDEVFDFLDPSDKSATEIMDALVDAIRPVDGTLDSEGSRSAIHSALSDLLSKFPDANLLALSEEQRIFAVERYLALDVYGHFCRDMGKTLQEKAPSLKDVLFRLKDVKDYIAEVVSARFRALSNLGQRLTRKEVVHLAHQSLQETFEVFEEYVK